MRRIHQSTIRRLVLALTFVVLAAALGMCVGAARSVGLDPPFGVGPRANADAPDSGRSLPSPVEPGRVEVTATVEVVYELEG